MDTKSRTTTHRAITDSHIKTNNQQRINNNRTTALEGTAYKATGDSNDLHPRSKLHSQHSMLDHQRHASEATFELRFADGLMLACLLWHLNSLIN